MIRKAFLLALMLFPAAKLAAGQVEVRVQPGDQLGRILQCVGYKHLWGPKGAVTRVVKLNANRKVRNEGNLIFPKTSLLIPAPTKGMSNDDLHEQLTSCVQSPEKALEASVPEEVPARRAKTKKSKLALESLNSNTSPKSTKNVGKTRKLADEEEDALGTNTASEPPSTADAELEAPAASDPKAFPFTPVKPEPEALAAEPSVTPTPTPTPAVAEKSRFDGELRMLHGRVGIEGMGASLNFGPLNTDQYSLLGFNALLALEVNVSRKLQAFAQGRIFALPISSGIATGVRPVDIEAGARIRVVEGAFRWFLLPALKYRTLLGLSAVSGYRNLLGLGVAVQGERPWGERSLAFKLGVTLFNSDTTFITPSNHAFSLCAGLGNRADWSQSTWMGNLCGELLSTEFTGGSGSDHRFYLGVERRF